MPSFVLFHLVFMSCAHLLDGLADMNYSHQLPGHVHLSSRWKAGTHNPFVADQSPAWCFDYGVLIWCFFMLTSLPISENI